MEFYFQDQLRWTFGFDNPNKGAALIASLLPLAWILASALARFRKPALKWMGIFVGTAIICAGWWLLFKTYSRGGIVAAIAAFGYIAFCSRKKLLKYWLPTLFGVIVIMGLFISTQAAQRSVGWVGGHEGSVENRFTLWKGGLEMVAENPLGVGRGRSGGVYMQWYQPFDDMTHYRTLVNSYLTFATEQGMEIFAVVVFFLAVIWCGTSPRLEAGFIRAAAIGTRAALVAFAVAGFFSTTMEEAKLWVVPGVCMVALVTMTLCKWEWKKWGSSFAQAAAATLALCGVVYITGVLLARSEPVRIALQKNRDDETVIVPKNKDDKSIRDCLCVMPDEQVMGADYGKLLRHLAAASHLRIRVSSSADFNQPNVIILASGEGVNRLVGLKGKEIVLLAPAKIGDADAAAILSTAKTVKLLLPGFDEDGRVAFWRYAMEDVKRPDTITSETLSGVGTEIVWAWETVVQQCSSGG